MDRPLFVLYPLPWWRSRRVVVAVLVAALALAVWLAYPSEDEVRPAVRVVPRVALQHAAEPVPSRSVADAPAPAPRIVAPAPPPPRLPLSTQIAPGVHVTPLSVPAGTTPEPAGPRAGDSEPEN